MYLLICASKPRVPYKKNKIKVSIQKYVPLSYIEKVPEIDYSYLNVHFNK